MKKITLLCNILAMLGLYMNLFSQTTFDWENAVDNGTNVTQTVDGITATVTGDLDDVDILDAGGHANSSGNVIYNFDANASSSKTVTFSSAVNIISIYIFDGDTSGGAVWTLTPMGGTDNEEKTQEIAPGALGYTVTANWTGVTSFIITSNTLGGGKDTFAIDNIEVAAPCSTPNADFNYALASYCHNAIDPTPTITGTTGGTFSAGDGLSINTTTGTVDISASTPGLYTITYTNGTAICGNSSDASITINALDDASFNYSAANYCANIADPTPTITGVTGGTFTSDSNLIINVTTGAIDVSASIPSTYTVTYTTGGACSNSATATVTINTVADASFAYSGTSYCVDGTDPTPTINGITGGQFTADGSDGLSINAVTGTIDVSASTPNTYTITYTTSGTCTNTSTATVTVSALDNASFAYGSAQYCVNNADTMPIISGVSGGTFTADGGSGLSLNSNTGAIDVSASTPNTYNVTYTTAGTCTNSSSVSVTITELDNASFLYGSSTYCTNDNDPTPTISGISGGTFTTSTKGLSINSDTGQIDVSDSFSSTYIVTYTTDGNCPNSSNTIITINDAPIISVTNNASVLTADQAAASYQWYQCPSTLLVGETDQSFTPTSNGDYKVAITQGSCVAESICVNVATLSTQTFENELEFSMYPNPTNENVNVKSSIGSGFKIINLLGQTVKTFKINANIERSLYVGDLNEGMYLIKETNNSTIAKKLIIKN